MEIKFFFECQVPYRPPGKRKDLYRAETRSHSVEIKELSNEEAPLVAFELVTPEQDINLIPFQPSDLLEEEGQERLLELVTERAYLIKWRFYENRFWINAAFKANYVVPGREPKLDKEYHSKERRFAADDVIPAKWPQNLNRIQASCESLNTAKQRIDNWATERFLVDGEQYTQFQFFPILVYSEWRGVHSISRTTKDYRYDHNKESVIFGVTAAEREEILKFVKTLESVKDDPNGELSNLKWGSQFFVLDDSYFTFNAAEYRREVEQEKKDNRYRNCLMSIERHANDAVEALEFLEDITLDFQSRVEKAQEEAAELAKALDGIDEALNEILPSEEVDAADLTVNPT